MTARKRLSLVVGDIVITAVNRHYRICRITTDGETQNYIESQPTRLAALARASELAGAHHRVFLTDSKSQSSAPIDCTDVARHAKASRR